jgi:C-terminal processing protease CtpA/Prc
MVRAGEVSWSRRFDYRKPVAILLDEGCFSATDIFVGAFKGWPGVTLIGQPSGGGSARAQSFSLPNSRLSIRCASMASFQPDGKLYDTNGVAPEIVVPRPPEYYLNGGEDVILEKALSVLTAPKKK